MLFKTIKSRLDQLVKFGSTEEAVVCPDQLRRTALTKLREMRLPTQPKANALIDVIDFFSGCGGLSLGFEAVSEVYPLYRTVAAIDFDKHANASFRTNLGITPLQIDIRRLSMLPSNRLRTLLGVQNNGKGRRPLVVMGGPPCQGFSSHRKKDKRKDSRNTLVGLFAKIAVKLEPDAILVENVPDLLAAKHWRYFEVLRITLENAGYQVKAKILNAAEFGVPQERFRSVVLAFKQDFDFPEGHLSRARFKTVRNAIASLPPLKAGERSESDPMHITSQHRKETIEILRKIPKDGGSRPRGIGPKCLDRVAGFYDVYGRLPWDRPAVTITARCRTPSCGRFAHPEQDRGLSVREASLLQGFPKMFMFEGPFDDKFKQVGNAVAPPLATALAAHIFSVLSAEKKDRSRKDSHVGYITSPISNSYSSVIAGIKRQGSIEVARVA